MQARVTRCFVSGGRLAGIPLGGRRRPICCAELLVVFRSPWRAAGCIHTSLGCVPSCWMASAVAAGSSCLLPPRLPAAARTATCIPAPPPARLTQTRRRAGRCLQVPWSPWAPMGGVRSSGGIARPRPGAATASALWQAIRRGNVMPPRGAAIQCAPTLPDHPLIHLATFADHWPLQAAHLVPLHTPSPLPIRPPQRAPPILTALGRDTLPFCARHQPIGRQQPCDGANANRGNPALCEHAAVCLRGFPDVKIMAAASGLPGGAACRSFEVGCPRTQRARRPPPRPASSPNGASVCAGYAKHLGAHAPQGGASHVN